MTDQTVFNYLAIISTSGLILSEILAWSACEAKGITQIYKLFNCKKQSYDNGTQTEMEEDDDLFNPNVLMESVFDTDSEASYQSTE
jgi:hypothetical protein